MGVDDFIYKSFNFETTLFQFYKIQYIYDIITGFSLSKWYTEYGLMHGAKLEDWMISHLLNDLKISSYLNTRQCRRSDAKYSHSTHGWNKGDSSINIDCFVITVYLYFS